MDSTKEHNNTTQQVLSICYGYGGLERGVNGIIPIKPVAYLEIEAFQVFNLVAAMESGMVDPAPIWTDLKTFAPAPFHNKIHGIIGGYPCQGESSAGKRKLWNDPRFLWPYIEGIMRTSRPLWGFFENVAAHLSGSFPYILSSLRSMGYNVESGLFTAEEVGAPQGRKRLFILAVDHPYINELQAQRARRLGMDGNILQNIRGQENTIGLRKTGKELGDTYLNGHGTGSNPTFKESGKIEGETQGKNGKRLRNVIRDTSQKLAHTNSVRIGESMQESKPREFSKNGKKWVARPGEPQHEWEAPRTIGKINRLPNSLRSAWSKNRKNFTKILGEKVW